MARRSFRPPFGCKLEISYEDPTIHESSGTDWSATVSHAVFTSQQCGIYHGYAVVADSLLVRHKESACVDRWAGPGELQLTLRPT